MSMLLAFKLGGEEYCIDILRVKEIRSYVDPTRVVDAHDCIEGVVNLRGAIVPIVDMRLRFGFPVVTYDSLTSTSAGPASRRTTASSKRSTDRCAMNASTSAGSHP